MSKPNISEHDGVRNLHFGTQVIQGAMFYAACADCLTTHGIMTVNIFCDRENHSHNIEAIEQSFSAVAWLPEVHDSNIVAVAFKQAPSIDFEQLYLRAKKIEHQLALPATTWVDGLMHWMRG